jgi:hypothetical protein
MVTRWRSAQAVSGSRDSMLLIGVGFGAAMPALMALGMSGATDRDAGLAAGLLPWQRSPPPGRTSSAQPARPRSLTGGYHLAFAVAAGL